MLCIVFKRATVYTINEFSKNRPDETSHISRPLGRQQHVNCTYIGDGLFPHHISSIIHKAYYMYRQFRRPRLKGCVVRCPLLLPCPRAVPIVRIRNTNHALSNINQQIYSRHRRVHHRQCSGRCSNLTVSSFAASPPDVRVMASSRPSMHRRECASRERTRCVHDACFVPVDARELRSRSGRLWAIQSSSSRNHDPIIGGPIDDSSIIVKQTRAKCVRM